jgi:transcriptional regulator with XRE-family HTH domain
MESTMGLVSNEIRKAMDLDGRTRYALSKASGVSESTLCRWYAGQRELSLEAAEKLMGVLGLTITKSKTPAKRAGGKAR